MLIQELEEKRERVYLAYSSPRYDVVRNKNAVSDPTLRAVNRIMELDEKIDEYSMRFNYLKDRIMSAVSDPTIRNTIFWYYILAYDWEDVPKVTRNLRRKLRAYIEEHMTEQT